MSGEASVAPDVVTIALDCMGGDKGCVEPVKAAAELSLERSDLRVLLVGDQAQISAHLDEQRYDPAHLAVQHSAGCADCTLAPAEALKRAPQASILLACDLVAEGRAQAVVTIGSTGAAILAAARRLGLIPGVRRAALAAVTPTELSHGPKEDPFALLLDVGATLTASPRDLVTFAIMGSAYAQAISGNPEPKVALLSNGTEAHKGLPEIVAAHQTLRRLDAVRFCGNIEGIDIPRGTADVVVTSGFVGNVVLKMLEGVGEVISDLASDAKSGRLRHRVGLRALRSGLQQIKLLLDWEQYGGAPILGFQQPIIKAHGRSRSTAVANACKVAAKAVRHDMVGTVQRGLTRLPSIEEEQGT